MACGRPSSSRTKSSLVSVLMILPCLSRTTAGTYNFNLDGEIRLGLSSWLAWFVFVLVLGNEQAGREDKHRQPAPRRQLFPACTEEPLAVTPWPALHEVIRAQTARLRSKEVVKPAPSPS